MFEVEALQLADLHENLGYDASRGGKQNFKIRDSAGKEIDRRDPKYLLLYALQGGYSNETDRYLISDLESF